MQTTFIDTVTLVEIPSEITGPFYVVEGKRGKLYVSSMGGRAAKGLLPGVTLKLYKRESKLMSAYILDRV